tara:strand:- start:19172 stop:19585 length:414 start_codon:yes stop_codon:yes gene_type:complete
MAGEQNGTNCLLYRLDEGGSDQDEVLVGQLELNRTFNGAPIDISSKSDNDWIKYINNEMAGRGNTISGTIVYNNDAEYAQMRADAQAGVIRVYVLDYTGLAADELRFEGIAGGLSDELPVGDKVTTSFTITSTGVDL